MYSYKCIHLIMFMPSHIYRYTYMHMNVCVVCVCVCVITLQSIFDMTGLNV